MRSVHPIKYPVPPPRNLPRFTFSLRDAASSLLASRILHCRANWSWILVPSSAYLSSVPVPFPCPFRSVHSRCFQPEVTKPLCLDLRMPPSRSGRRNPLCPSSSRWPRVNLKRLLSMLVSQHSWLLLRDRFQVCCCECQHILLFNRRNTDQLA